MNFKAIGKILGRIAILEAILMLLPFVVSLIYHEDLIHTLAFPIVSVFLLAIGLVLTRLKPSRRLHVRDAFTLCGLTWILMGVFGAIPFVINGDIPNYIDALFEIVSGFTTTGSSILSADKFLDGVNAISHSSIFWRSFSHWIGGMGILVFILIFIPESDEGTSFHILKAESPGPQVGKIVSKMRATTKILYLIYFVLTAIETGLLCLGKMDIFSALTLSFGTAGTGGFGILSTSIASYSAYCQYIIAVFMLLFGVNFTLYYFILIGKFKDAFKNEELHSYFIIVVIAVIIIFISLLVKNYQNFDFELTFRESLFQVASIITTTGYSTTDFNLWPEIAKMVILLLMLFGAMAGSTGGGIKISRIVMAFKGIVLKFKKLVHPHYAGTAKLDNKPLEEDRINDIFFYLTIYAIITIIVTLILSLDPWKIAGANRFESNLTATISCLSNIGPGLGSAVGPMGNFAHYSGFSKIVLTITMITGRLEFFPILILFNYKTWFNRAN